MTCKGVLSGSGGQTASYTDVYQRTQVAGGDDLSRLVCWSLFYKEIRS